MGYPAGMPKSEASKAKVSATLRAKWEPEKFWSRRIEVVRVPSLGACWEWSGARLKKGYGQASYKGQRVLAHRLSWFLTHSEWPENALHRCDNPPCFRPEHLFDGSVTDNYRDMAAKGRTPLTEQAVSEIRRACSAGEPQGVIAARCGVSPRTVSGVVGGRTWRGVGDTVGVTR